MRFAPISITALRCEGSSRISVSGTPMWLLRLPWVAMHGPRRDRMAAVISLAVVLPLLPATPTIGMREFARARRAASCCSARSASATTICGRAARATGRSTMRADGAARARPRPTKSAPSKFGPRSATNSAPAASVRLSVDTDAVRPILADAAGRRRALRRIAERALHAAAPRLRSASRRSLKLRRVVAVDLIVLVSLAGDQHHVGRRRPR